MPAGLQCYIVTYSDILRLLWATSIFEVMVVELSKRHVANQRHTNLEWLASRGPRMSRTKMNRCKSRDGRLFGPMEILWTIGATMVNQGADVVYAEGRPGGVWRREVAGAKLSSTCIWLV